VNEAWLTRAETGRPFVTLKLATTLDGRVAAADRTSRWITSAGARADAHAVRAEADAIAVGIGTVLADDPHLTVRTADGALVARQPLRVVLDSGGRTPVGARVLDGAAPVTVVTTAGGASTLGDLGSKVDVAVVDPGRDGRVDLVAALAALLDRGVVHLLVEGGPRVSASFVDADLVDRAVVYVAPALMGSGPPAVDGGAGTPTIDALRRLRLDDVRRVGDDVRLVARRAGR